MWPQYKILSLTKMLYFYWFLAACVWRGYIIRINKAYSYRTFSNTQILSFSLSRFHKGTSFLRTNKIIETRTPASYIRVGLPQVHIYIRGYLCSGETRILHLHQTWRSGGQASRSLVVFFSFFPQFIVNCPRNIPVASHNPVYLTHKPTQNFPDRKIRFSDWAFDSDVTAKNSKIRHSRSHGGWEVMCSEGRDHRAGEWQKCSSYPLNE